MTKIGLSRKILGERVSHHVARSAVNECDLSRRDTVTQGVYTIINVFGTFPVDGIFRHESASTVILVERSRCVLRKVQGGKKATLPDDLVGSTAG
jgi:hypothetical protein